MGKRKTDVIFPGLSRGRHEGEFEWEKEIPKGGVERRLVRILTFASLSQNDIMGLRQ